MVPIRGSLAAVAGFLVLASPSIAAGEESEWDDLPPEWAGDIDYAAFCRAGVWSFASLGDRADQCDAPSCATSTLSIDQVFFKIRHGRYRARWHGWESRADELTVLKIARTDAGEITIQASAGDVLAVQQVYPVSRSAGLFRRERPTECKPGRAWRFQSDWWAYDEGEEFASLALAADGSLLAHVRGKYKHRLALLPFMVLSDEKWRYYARFPALSVGSPAID